MEPTDLGRGWGTVVLAASGPSFSEEQADLIAASGVRVIAVNDAYKRLPSAGVVFASDPPWWKINRPHVKSEAWSQFIAKSLSKVPRFEDVTYVESLSGKGLCKTPGVIHQGGNSGFMALNLAYHFGAKRIALVGFDCQKTGGKSHFFGDHQQPLSRSHAYKVWIEHFELIAADLESEGIEVVNCTTETALTCFPLCDLACVLEAARA